jgi:VWFA-related protein
MAAKLRVGRRRRALTWSQGLVLPGALLWTLALAQAPPPAVVAPAAPPANTAEVTTTDAPATFSSRVNLVMVPVIVRDRQGRPIGTLHKEDFLLFDQGKPQIISRFSLESGIVPAVIPAESNVDAGEPAPAASPAGVSPSGTSPSDIAGHFIALLFDDLHVEIGDLQEVRTAAERYLTESWDPASRAAIFTTSGQTTLDFTDDRAKLRETLANIRPHPGRIRSGSDCPDLTYYMADQIEQSAGGGVIQGSVLDVTVQEIMRNCPPPSPQVTPQEQQQALQQAQLQAMTEARRVVNLGDRDTRMALGVLKDVIRRIALMPGRRSIILVSPGFMLQAEHHFDETELMDRAIRASTTISSLNARGLYTLTPGGDASQRGSVDPLKVQYQRESALAEDSILAELADGTGGTYFHNNNDLLKGFEQLATPPEFVYLLGFTAQSLKFDGSFHALKVSLKAANGLGVQARRGYYAPRHANNLEDQAREEIQEALFSRDESNDIPVDLHTQFFKTSDAAAKLAVIARLDLRHLRFRKAEERNRNTLTVTAGLFDRNGIFISGLQKVVGMQLRDQTLQTVMNAGISVRTNFDVTPGTYVIRVVVRDSEGQTMSARNGAVEIP